MVRLNVAMLRRGMRIGSQALLTVAGRKTGQPRSTPVSIATVAGKRFIVAAFPEADWVRNVRAAGVATITSGRTTEHVRLIEIPVEDRPPMLRAFLEQVRGGRRFFGTSDPDEVAAAAASFPVFRIEPAGTSTGT
jgi:deazaflavin-dependent oxidoreductase (nitroreductase family)